VDGHPHRPGPDQRALLRSRRVDVGGGQLSRAGSEMQRPGETILRLGAGDLPRYLNRIFRRCGPMQQLRRRAAPR